MSLGTGGKWNTDALFNCNPSWVSVDEAAMYLEDFFRTGHHPV